MNILIKTRIFKFSHCYNFGASYLSYSISDFNETGLGKYIMYVTLINMVFLAPLIKTERKWLIENKI